MLTRQLLYQMSYDGIKLGAGGQNRTGLLQLGRLVGYHSLTRIKYSSLRAVMFRRLIRQAFILHFDGLVLLSLTIHKLKTGWSVDLDDTI